LEIVKALIDKGVDVNQADSEGKTALMWACLTDPFSDDTLPDRSDIVEALHHAGAHIDIQCQRGFTALMYASQGGLKTVVEFLLASGADHSLTVRSQANSETACDLAQSNNHGEIVDIINGYTRTKRRKKRICDDDD